MKETFSGYDMMKEDNQQLAEHYYVIIFSVCFSAISLHLAVVLISFL